MGKVDSSLLQINLKNMMNIGDLYFKCNICGTLNLENTSKLGREVASCSGCNSSVRQRSLIHSLSIALFGESISCDEFRLEHQKAGIGLSVPEIIAEKFLENKNLGFINTYYYKEPLLDIVNPDNKYLNKFDYLISSDVFEHVPPPIIDTFKNVRKILKPGGALILTVPYTLDSQTVEHYPDLFEYQIKNNDGRKIIINKTKSGTYQQFENPVFHGGHSEEEEPALEMRIFSLNNLIENLNSAGFQRIKVIDQPEFKFGVYFPDSWSLPIIAK